MGKMRRKAIQLMIFGGVTLVVTMIAGIAGMSTLYRLVGFLAAALFFGRAIYLANIERKESGERRLFLNMFTDNAVGGVFYCPCDHHLRYHTFSGASERSCSRCEFENRGNQCGTATLSG